MPRPKGVEIFHDYSDKTELPLMEIIWDPDRFRPSTSAEAITLRPGDVLYMPRGVMHQAFCVERESMHLTVSVVPLTFADLLVKALKLAAVADIDLRRRVPWSIESENGRSEELITKARERVTKLADQIDVGAVLKTERRSFREEPETGASGELESAVASLVKSAGI
jgi:ribosomal protein L16 Arg81 hydroxylase